MLDLKYVVEHLDEVRQRLKYRADDAMLDTVGELARARKECLLSAQALRQSQNEANAAIKDIVKSGKGAEVQAAVAARREELKRLSDDIRQADAQLKTAEQALADLMLRLPNLPAADVPEGADEHANLEVRRCGAPRVFDFPVKDHADLVEALRIVDFERAAKLSGARFAVYFGQGARLERALIHFMLDQHVAHGYTEVLPPFLVSRETMQGTGQLPKFEEDLFRTAGEKELFLIPTAEVPVTNLHADEILPREALPLKYCSYTSCFRSEAGSYGRDVRGLIRQHQFQKVEMVKFCTPEQSDAEQEAMVADAERILTLLGLPYRVMKLSQGDMGFSAARCYDLEVWLPSQNAYREISSCSTCADFQARRAKIRFKDERGQNRFVHTLNGSGLAVGRTVVAIVENYQQADGDILVPEALRPYMGGAERITARA